MKKRTNKEISFLKNRAISIYKLSRTEYKQLAHSQNGVSVLGRILERGFNFRGNIFPNRLPIWSPGWHIPTQKIPKRLPPSPPGLNVTVHTLRLGKPNTMCRKSRSHYLHCKRLIWAHFGLNSSQCNRYCEKTLSYSKKYGVLSRPGYLSRCMHSNNSNNMCSPNSVFLSVEENQKRFVFEDKWRLERT